MKKKALAAPAFKVCIHPISFGYERQYSQSQTLLQVTLLTHLKATTQNNQNTAPSVLQQILQRDQSSTLKVAILQKLVCF